MARKLTETVTYRCSKRAKRELQRAAKRRGVSPSDFAAKAVGLAAEMWLGASSRPVAQASPECLNVGPASAEPAVDSTPLAR